MSHEISSLDRVNLNVVGGQAWHNLGIMIEDGLSAVDAGEKGGMFWPVAQRPTFWQDADGSYHAIESHVANVRTRDTEGNSIRHLLGVVGADYSVCQNRELAEFTDALAQTGGVTIESCGSIKGGKRVWFLAKGDAFNIGGTTDKVWPYLLVSNGHDGGQAIRVTPTTIRVVCSNTLHMVIPREEGERPEEAALAIRHCGSISDKLEQAKLALQYYGQTLARNREMFEAMQSQKISRDQAVKVFGQTYSAMWEAATAEELDSTDAKIKRTAELRMGRMQSACDAFLARYDEENVKVGTGETAWACFNAMSGFIQHDRNARGKDDAARVERRMNQNLFGINAARTHEVLATVLALGV